MLNFHKEGNKIIRNTIVMLLIIEGVLFFAAPFVAKILIVPFLILLYLVLQFFRNPSRPIPTRDNNLIYAPADGKVVVIEEIFQDEYVESTCIQISIFMSPLNVHVNRYPLDGIVEYIKYYHGKYLPAWDPKSSTENERSAIGIKTGKHKILVKQIAGAVARRIVYYPKEGDQAKQGEDFGFIKFGSRVDIMIPKDANILVQHDQVVKGNQTVLAKLN